MESRLTDLEIRFTHQEATLEAVQNTLLLQQKTIEDLQAKLSLLQQQIRALAPGDIAPLSEEAPPPHY